MDIHIIQRICMIMAEPKLKWSSFRGNIRRGLHKKYHEEWFWKISHVFRKNESR